MTVEGKRNPSNEPDGDFFPTALEPAPGAYDVEELAAWTGCDRRVLETILFTGASDDTEGACCGEGNPILGMLDDIIAPAGWETVDQIAKRFNLRSDAAAYLAKIGVPKGGRPAYPRHLADGAEGVKSDVFFDPKYFPPIEAPLNRKNDLELRDIARKSRQSLEVTNSYIHLENAATRLRQKNQSQIVACVDKSWGALAIPVLKELQPLPDNNCQPAHLEIAAELSNIYGVPVNPQGVYKKLKATAEGQVQLYREKDRVVALMTKDQADAIKQKYHKLLAPHYPVMNTQRYTAQSVSREPKPAPKPQRTQAPRIRQEISKERNTVRHRMSDEPVDQNIILPGRVMPSDLPDIENRITGPGILRYPEIGHLEDILGVDARILAAVIKYYPKFEENNYDKDGSSKHHVGYDRQRKTIVTSRRANAVLCGIFTKNLGEERSIRIPPHWSILNGIAEAVYASHSPAETPTLREINDIVELLADHAWQNYEGSATHSTRVEYIGMPNATHESFVFCSPRLARELLKDSAEDSILASDIKKVIEQKDKA